MRGGPSLKGKGGLVGFRKSLKVQGSTGGFSKKATSKQPLSKSLSEGGFIPAQKTAAPLLAQTSDGPPSLQRSGLSTEQGGWHIPCPLRGKGLGKSGGPSLKGKGGLVGFRRFLKVQGSTCSFSKVHKKLLLFFRMSRNYFQAFEKPLLMLRRFFESLF